MCQESECARSVLNPILILGILCCCFLGFFYYVRNALPKMEICTAWASCTPTHTIDNAFEEIELLSKRVLKLECHAENVKTQDGQCKQFIM